MTETKDVYDILNVFDSLVLELLDSDCYLVGGNDSWEPPGWPHKPNSCLALCDPSDQR